MPILGESKLLSYLFLFYSYNNHWDCNNSEGFGRLFACWESILVIKCLASKLILAGEMNWAETILELRSLSEFPLNGKVAVNIKNNKTPRDQMSA
jgi:hypothetical protein